MTQQKTISVTTALRNVLDVIDAMNNAGRWTYTTDSNVDATIKDAKKALKASAPTWDRWDGVP
jgi:hypothetical protein